MELNKCLCLSLQVSLDDLLKEFVVKTVTPSSLSLTRDSDAVSATDSLDIEPMQLKAFKLALK